MSRADLLIRHLLFISLHFLPGVICADEPRELSIALGLPPWLKITGEQRSRYETQDEQFRAGQKGSDQILALRTSFLAQVDFSPFKMTAELSDARQYLTDSGSAVDTNTVNSFELLQSYLEWNLGHLGTGQHYIRLGRETIDLGNRRLIARNSFRNTVNAFSGIDWRWEAQSDTSLRALWLLPNQRQPDDLTSIQDNDIAFDDQDLDLQLWALYLTLPFPFSRSSLEFYTFGLHETGENTRERQLYTPGLRLIRQAEVSTFDFELESIYQIGQSSATIGGDKKQNRSHFQHLSLGYTFDLPTQPNLRLSYDYASGDRDPDDNENNRFDTLYGARRFEYGPTGSYGAIARSNLSSPEIRLNFKPTTKTEFMIAHRGIWLASSTDAWTAAGVRDASGNSGHFVGQQLEARLRWEVIPENLRLEIGLAQLFPGSYLDSVPNGYSADTTYTYLEMTWRF